MSDLANVYELFRNKFEEYDFQCYYPPSYIRTLTENTDRIILAFKKNHDTPPDKNRIRVKTSPESNTDSIMSNSLDITGSPLKDMSNIEESDLSNELIDQCVQNCWTPEEEAYGPLATDRARSVLQNFINLECRIGRGSIWALCCGTDAERTVLVQLFVNAASSNQRQFTRGIVRFTGVQGCNSITMPQLIGIHRQRAGEGMKLNPKIHIQQWYKLCPQITLRLSWHTMGESGTFAIERNARVRLSQHFPVNNGAFSRSSPAEYLWQQLQRLALMREKILDIRANREAGYARNDFGAEGTEMGLEYVKQKVNNILSTFLAVEPDTYSNASSIVNMVHQVEKRNLTDVMERLYEALTLCSNYDDLKATIDYIFHLSTHSNIVNVPTNGTRFAQLILAMIQDRLAIPSLTGSEPYELLLECGFSKLMNDYRTIFTESGVYELEFEKLFQPQVINTRKSRYATGPSPQSDATHRATIHSLFQPATIEECRGREKSILVSNFDEDEVKLRLNRLTQVHLLLEHILLLESVVNIPSIYGRVCELYLNRQPYSYGEVYNRDTDLLEFDVDEFMLLRKVDNLPPCGRRVSLTSANLLQKLETVFYQNGQPILPERFYPQFQCDDTKSKQVFWCYEYDRIERL